MKVGIVLSLLSGLGSHRGNKKRKDKVRVLLLFSCFLVLAGAFVINQSSSLSFVGGDL